MSSEISSHRSDPEFPSFSRLQANEKVAKGRNEINQAVINLAGSHPYDAPVKADLEFRLIGFDSEGYPCPALYCTAQYVAALLAGKISIQRHFALPKLGFPNELYLKARPNGTDNPLWKPENHSEYLGISQYLLHSAILSCNPAIKLVDGVDRNHPEFGILSFEKYVRQKLIKLKKHCDSERKFSLSALSDRDIAIIGVFAAIGKNEIYWRSRACAALEHPKLARSNAKYFLTRFGNVVLDELDAIDVARGFVEKRYLYKEFGAYPFNTNAFRLNNTTRTAWPYTALDNAIVTNPDIGQASETTSNAKRIRNRGVAWKAFSTYRHMYGLDVVRRRSRDPVVGTLGAMFGDAQADFLDMAYRPDAIGTFHGPDKKKRDSKDMGPDQKNGRKAGESAMIDSDSARLNQETVRIDTDDDHGSPGRADLQDANGAAEPDIGNIHENEAGNDRAETADDYSGRGQYSLAKPDISFINRPQLINDLRLTWDKILPKLNLNESEELILIATMDDMPLSEMSNEFDIEYETIKKRRQNLFKKIRKVLTDEDKEALESCLKEFGSI